MAFASAQITSVTVQASEFYDLARKYRVSGVPKIVGSNGAEILGALPEAQFVEELLGMRARRNGAALTADLPESQADVPLSAFPGRAACVEAWPRTCWHVNGCGEPGRGRQLPYVARVAGPLKAKSPSTVSHVPTVMQIAECDGFPALKATSRILDTPARGLIHLQSIAQPNVAAILPSAEPSSLRPAHQAADDGSWSARLVRLYAVPAGRVAWIR